MLEIKDLHVKLAEEDKEIIKGLSLAVPKGEVHAIMGPNGSGKSTLLNVISGIDLPMTGEVVVNGVSLTRLSEHERTVFRRGQIGFVFQFFNLIATLTVEDNLLLPLELNGRLNEATRKHALGLLAEVGLLDRATSFPDQLSGGEQQRVAIARALVHAPALLLADEPTGNLDSENGEIVLSLLLEMSRDAGKVLLMATHAPEIARRADRVLHIVDGKLV